MNPEIPEAWYLDESTALTSDDKLPTSQKGRFVCTSGREHFTLFFANGDIMWLQPGVVAYFEGVCQGEEEEDDQW